MPLAESSNSQEPVPMMSKTSPPIGTPTHNWRTRVAYHECDPMGVVHHAVHVQWLGNARSDWCRSLGLPYTKLEEQGWWLAVRECSVVYEAPAHHDECVDVKLWLTSRTSTRMRHSYVLQVDDRVIARAHTELVCLNRNWRPSPIPPALLELIPECGHTST